VVDYVREVRVSIWMSCAGCKSGAMPRTPAVVRSRRAVAAAIGSPGVRGSGAPMLM
jgi:hypothetical protein